jgi:hypothetical protein
LAGHHSRPTECTEAALLHDFSLSSFLRPTGVAESSRFRATSFSGQKPARQGPAGPPGCRAAVSLGVVAKRLSGGTRPPGSRRMRLRKRP